jgi:hypothetical protein
MPIAARPLTWFARTERRFVKALAAVLVLTFATVGLVACSHNEDPADPEAAGEPLQDTGVVALGLVPKPATPGDKTGLEDILKTADKPEEGWVSGPWALASTPDKTAKQIQIIYVAGDLECYGTVGFTLNESKSEVTIGSYLSRKGSQSACPTNPASAYKWGTIELTSELGDRQLTHAGVANMFKDFTWDRFTAAPKPPPSADTEPSQEEESE